MTNIKRPSKKPTSRSSKSVKPAEAGQPLAFLDELVSGAAPPPLGEQAYVAIKRLIMTRALKPGDQINVNQLSQQLGLGRSPIHLAVHRLDREGLVAILPRKGILVKAETLESFIELITARQLVEPCLVKLATERVTPELLARLEQLVATGWNYHHEKNRFGEMEVDRLFHQAIYAYSGNSVLAAFAAQLLDRSMRFWVGPEDPSAPNIAELQSMLDTIRKGDANAAQQMMEAHIGSIRRKILR